MAKPLLDLDVIDDPTTAVVALDPTRADILAQLTEPGSATTVAKALGLARQKVNYHLRALEDHGLVSLVEERPRRGLTERVVQASARGYVLSSATLGPNAADPAHTDHLSTSYLIAVAARLVREVGDLARRARREAKPLATLTIDTELTFASAEARASFTAELTEAITTLVARHHDDSSPRGRPHRLVVAAHPVTPPNPTTT